MESGRSEEIQANYANEPDTKRSTTGYVLTLNGATVIQDSKRQHTVALSPIEAKFMAACVAIKINYMDKAFATSQ